MLNIQQIPYSYAKRHGVLVHVIDDEPTIIHKESTDLSALTEARRLIANQTKTHTNVTYQLIQEDEFDKLLGTSYAGDSGESQQIADGLDDHPDLLSLADQVPETEDLMDQEENAPIIKLINAILSESIRLGASDIHIETFEKKLSVRFRVDGQLREIVQPKRALAPLLVSRIKVMAKLDIAEKRIPQDGRISLKLAGREIDVRVSTLPASYGERVVMRLLDKQSSRLNLSHLGLSETNYDNLKKLIFRPHGIILVTGPTGSGKTTTLYSAISELNDNTRNIMTAEDPIEYQIEGISQTPVNNKVDMTFAKSLRAMLRQDPDVVMVGEIRDLETAEIAVQASLTGHLVLSTLHTNTAIGAISRLKDMGVEPFLLSSSLLGVIAQRLVRTLCSHCKQMHPASEYEYETLKHLHPSTDMMIGKPVGCEKCNQSGFKGRTAIYEVVTVNEELRKLIHSEVAEFELEHHARNNSASIRDDGFSKVLAGQTTLEEVLRATKSD